MDERDAEALGRGLASGLADAFAAALDRTVGASAISELEKTAEQENRATVLRAMRDGALEDCRREWKAGREWCATVAEKAAGAHCARALKAISKKGKSDPRLPETINYLQRYKALRKVGSRNVLLGRLAQTLDLADAIIAKAGQVDVESYFAEAAVFYHEQVLRLEGIAVAEPVHDEAEEHAKQQEQGIADALRRGDEAASASYEDAMAALDEQLEKVFADEIRALEAPDSPFADVFARADDAAEGAAVEESAETEFEKELDALSKQLDEIVKRMRQQYDASCEANAALVATSRLSLGDLPRFDGRVSCKLRYDVAEVAAFAAEVRRSFATYKQVVNDNGVFTAFSDGSDFGKCRGTLSLEGAWIAWILGDEVGSAPKAAAGIPSEIEEDDVKGGDSPARATEKLRQLNQKRYFGLLDEDFACHVEAFWYGFRKLMEFTNGLFEVNPREFVDYCDALRTSTEKRARALGVLMSEDQAKDFVEQAKGLLG